MSTVSATKVKKFINDPDERGATRHWRGSPPPIQTSSASTWRTSS